VKRQIKTLFLSFIVLPCYDVKSCINDVDLEADIVATSQCPL